jgi:hypothetical protein
MLTIDRAALIESMGGEDAALAMDHEARADAVEAFMEATLDARVRARESGKTFPTTADHESAIPDRRVRRGIGKLFRPVPAKFGVEDDDDKTLSRLPPMPERPTLVDFFELRFAPAAHLLQSAALAKRNGASEEVILACLLHDIGNSLMKVEHGYWSAQLIEPYVSEKVTFAVRYHQPLRFFPDPAVGYDYPKRYFELFGIDYVPPPYVLAEYERIKNHKWYMEARLVTMNDLYAFDPDVVVSIDEFRDVIDRHFRQPVEGLGYDHTPASHMWRAMANPDSPL